MDFARATSRRAWPQPGLSTRQGKKFCGLKTFSLKDIFRAATSKSRNSYSPEFAM
jgi:hypothetical protein